MKTSTLKPSAPKWLIIDAEGKNLGRLAALAASVLRGKHKPTFSPHQLCGDHIVVINAGKLMFPASKHRRKIYVKHTGYLGHIRTKSLQWMIDNKPEGMIEEAVKGMLPRNRLRAKMLSRLHVFPAAEHTHVAQNPEPLSIPA